MYLSARDRNRSSSFCGVIVMYAQNLVYQELSGRPQMNTDIHGHSDCVKVHIYCPVINLCIEKLIEYKTYVQALPYSDHQRTNEVLQDARELDNLYCKCC